MNAAVLGSATFVVAAVMTLACCAQEQPTVRAGGKFDGTWRGEPTTLAQGDCGHGNVVLVVAGDVIKGRFSGVYRGDAVWGDVNGSPRIGSDGAVSFTVGTRTFPGRFVFQGDTFTGQLSAFCGERAYTGKREP